MNRYIQLLSTVTLCALTGVAAFAHGRPAPAQPVAAQPVTAQPVTAQPIHVVDVVVASPRATIAPVPFPQVDDAQDAHIRSVGAAWNFARHALTVRMRLGNVLHTKLSDEIEGVWYPRACGFMGTLLVLEIQRPYGSGQWSEIGRDGAAGHACGPRIGTARVGVRYRPLQPGVYKLRARIATYAIPTRPDDAAQVASGKRVVVQNEVMIRLIVGRRPVAEPDAYQEPVTELPEELLLPE